MGYKRNKPNKSPTDDEDRFIMLGMGIESRVLVVCHCEHEAGNVVRIISARKATKSERKYYSGGLR